MTLLHNAVHALDELSGDVCNGKVYHEACDQQDGSMVCRRCHKKWPTKETYQQEMKGEKTMTTQPPKCPHCGAEESAVCDRVYGLLFICQTLLVDVNIYDEQGSPSERIEQSDACKHAAQLRKERDDLERENNRAHIALHETLEDDIGLTLEQGIRQLGNERDAAEARAIAAEAETKLFEAFVQTGREWAKDSSLEKWFPFTAQRLDTLTQLLREALPLLKAYSNTNAVGAAGGMEIVLHLCKRIEQAIKESEGKQPDTVQVPRETIDVLKACALVCAYHACFPDSARQKARAALKELESL